MTHTHTVFLFGVRAENQQRKFQHVEAGCVGIEDI